jgi:hypothetical protein
LLEARGEQTRGGGEGADRGKAARAGQELAESWHG